MQIHELGIPLLPGLPQILIWGWQLALCQVRVDLCPGSVYQIGPVLLPQLERLKADRRALRVGAGMGRIR